MKEIYEKLCKTKEYLVPPAEALIITCTTECDLYFTSTILSLLSLLIELCCLKIFQISEKKK